MKNILLFSFLLLAALIGSLFSEHCGAASTNAVEQTLIDSNLAAKVAADYEKYKKGEIDKGQMMQSVWEANDHTRQDLYGKVIDQDGQPVAGVDVTGISERLNDKDIRYKTQTDVNGLFQFTGLHGYRLGAEVSKAGYEMDYRWGIFKPSDQSSPTNRVIYTMWKEHGPEPMLHVQIQSPVLNGDEGKRFDLLKSKMETLWDVDEIRVCMKFATGDLTVTVNCDPSTTNRHQPFNWSCSLAITNGGLCETTNIYPYQAPADGYESVVKMDFPTNMANWKNECRRTYYFTSNHGQAYGRMALHLSAGSKFALFQAEIYVNPAGSRNLEFDSAKQIMR